MDQNPPGSGKFPKKKIDLNKVMEINKDVKQLYTNSFVLGISGGDCSGKKQLIHYMFNEKNGELRMKDSNEVVTLIHQDYFIKNSVERFMSKGTDWEKMKEALINVLAGNKYTVKNAKLKEGTNIELNPGKLVVVEGSHIFMDENPIHEFIDSKIFIDSDSDVRLSRRIYKDTQDDGLDLNNSVENYLSNIKPSYEEQIQPCKIKSDIIIPHFGGGYDDHRRQNKVDYASNIHNARALILAHVREQMLLHSSFN